MRYLAFFILFSFSAFSENIVVEDRHLAEFSDDSTDDNPYRGLTLWSKDTALWWTTGFGAVISVFYSLGISSLDAFTLEKPFIAGPKLRWLAYPALSAVTGGFFAFGAAMMWPPKLSDPWPAILVESILAPLVLHSGMFLVYLHHAFKEGGWGHRRLPPATGDIP